MKSGIDQGANPKQLQAVILLASAKSVRETSKLLGISEQTIHLWKRDPEFISLLKTETKAHIENCRMWTATLVQKAIETLGDLLESESDAVRLKAVTEVLKANNLDKINEENHLWREVGL